jgi:hypothetical protein
MNRSPALLGASLIVRDEAGTLPRCLAALAGLVDEIVVHDTGSVDGTVELARRAGALVVQGGWQDDFAAARNEALRHNRSEWVLVVDADEVVVADVDRLRRLLASRPPRDGYTVEVLNHGAPDEGLGYQHRAARLFRREAAGWQGRVHERLVTADGGPLPLGPLPADLLRLEHHGYADPEVVRAKAGRNAQLLRAGLTELVARGDRDALPGLLVDLGRTLVGTGELQEAVDVLESVRELAPGTPEWSQATDFLARVLLGAGEDEVVMVLGDQLRQAGAERGYCDWLQAQAMAQLGEVGAALTLLRGIERLVDPAGREHDLGKVLEVRSMVAQLAGETEEAVACLVAAMAGHGRVEGRGASLLQLWGDRPQTELAALLRAAGPGFQVRIAEELRRCGAVAAATAALG